MISRDTHESKIPKDMEMGVREIWRGDLISREHIVRPVASSKAAFGSRAVSNFEILRRDLVPGKDGNMTYYFLVRRP